MSEVPQSRISLKGLKVSKFASKETLCFRATVLFDGTAIAEADNEGHGGMTVIRPLQGMQRQLEAAEAFAKGLPPEVTDIEDPNDPTRTLVLPMSLEFLVDRLASDEQADREYRQLFNRDIRSKLSFAVGDSLRYLIKVRPGKCTEEQIEVYCNHIRAKHGADTKILLKMPREEAFALWKKMLLRKPTRH